MAGGYAVVTSATMLACSHGGPATAMIAGRVTVEGSPVMVVTPSPSYAVACPVPSAPGRCVTAKWMTGSSKVTSGGMALAFESGTSLCDPTMVRLEIHGIQSTVTAK